MLSSIFGVRLIGGTLFLGGFLLLILAPIPPIFLLATSLPVLFYSSLLLLLKVDKIQIENNPGTFASLTQRHMILGLMFYFVALISSGLRGLALRDVSSLVLSVVVTLPSIFIGTNLSLAFPHTYGRVYTYRNGKSWQISKYGTMVLMLAIFSVFVASFIPLLLYSLIISPELLGSYYASLILFSLVLLLLMIFLSRKALYIYQHPAEFSDLNPEANPDPPRRLEIIFYILFTVFLVSFAGLPILAEIQGW